MKRLCLPLLILVALVVAPFGHMAAAEAMTPSHHSAMATPAHCPEMPAPAPHKGDRTDKAMIDCQAACAAMATLQAPDLPVPPAATSSRVTLPIPLFAGLQPEAETPPPRHS